MHEKRTANRWKEPPWTAPPEAPGRGGWQAQRWRSGAQAMRRDARAVSRGTPAAAAAAAPAGPRARRARVRGDDRAVAPARRVRAPGSGQGRASPAGRDWVGWGWETNAMRLRMQRIWHRPPAAFPVGELRLATLENLYLQTCNQGRSVLVSLLFRVFAFDRRATSWSPACRGAERVASPGLPRLFRYSAPRRRAFVVEFESPPQDPVRGWAG